MLMRLCQRLTDSGIRPVRVSFAHPRCDASTRPEACFGCKVAFAAGRDEVVFARGTAHLPLTEAEPYLNELLVHYCEEALARRLYPASPIRVRVENAIAPLLPHGTARVDEVARALGLSRRTLARRLAEEGLTFGGALEEMRRDLALHDLKDLTLSILRIAWLLGFQEVSGFTHAFQTLDRADPDADSAASAAVAPAADVECRSLTDDLLEPLARDAPGLSGLRLTRASGPSRKRSPGPGPLREEVVVGFPRIEPHGRTIQAGVHGLAFDRPTTAPGMPSGFEVRLKVRRGSPPCDCRTWWKMETAMHDGVSLVSSERRGGRADQPCVAIRPRSSAILRI